MLNLKDIKSVYLATDFTDLRKSIDGLAIIVQEEFQLDPFSPSLFVFCNRSRDRLKILHWEYNGFWLYLRRLERGKFNWPTNENDTIKVDLKELKWLLDGHAVRCGKVHEEVKQRLVI
jgi:transposase